MLFLLRKPPPENLHGKTVRFVYTYVWLQYDKQMYKSWISPKHIEYVPKEDEQTGNHKKDLLPVCSHIKSTNCNLHIVS